MRSRTVAGLAVVVLIALGGCRSAGSPPGQAGSVSPTVPAATVVPSASASPGPTGTAIRPPSVPPHSGTGIVGVVVVVGGCPVDRAEPACAQRPVSVPLVVVGTGTGTVVASVTSRADGTFRVALPPGRYEVRSTASTGPWMARPVAVPVEVPVGGYASVTVQFQAHLP